MFEKIKSGVPIRWRAAIAATLAGATVLGATSAADAHNWKRYYYGPPAYYAPPARYYAPRPVYYAPRPVYYAPRPAYYAPAYPAYRPYYGAPRVNFGISVPLR